MAFTPVYGDSKAKPVFDSARAREVDELDLRKAEQVPLGSIIRFTGIHPASCYLAKIVGNDCNRMVRLWWEGNDEMAAEASIVELASLNVPTAREDRGVLRVGEAYTLPYFEDRDGKRGLRPPDDGRLEVYQEILLQKP